jgi:uncharacterized membrane protein
LLAIIGNGEHTKDIGFLILGWLSFLSIPVQWIFYITNVFRNSTVAKNQRILWIVLLLWGSIFTFPFYWYLHIWKDAKTIQQGQSNYTTDNISVQKEKLKSKWKMWKIMFLIVGISPIILGLMAIITRLNEPTNILFDVLGWLAYISLVSLIILCVVNVYKNDSVAKNQRVLWIVLLIAGNVVIFPFYWYRHIWHEPKEYIYLQNS